MGVLSALARTAQSAYESLPSKRQISNASLYIAGMAWGMTVSVVGADSTSTEVAPTGLPSNRSNHTSHGVTPTVLGAGIAVASGTLALCIVGTIGTLAWCTSTKKNNPRRLEESPVVIENQGIELQAVNTVEERSSTARRVSEVVGIAFTAPDELKEGSAEPLPHSLPPFKPVDKHKTGLVKTSPMTLKEFIREI